MTSYERKAKICIRAARQRLGPAVDLVSPELVWALICKEIVDMFYEDYTQNGKIFLESFKWTVDAAAKMHETLHLPYEPPPKGKPCTIS